MPNEVLIIGSQRDYCYVIKEFLELRDLDVTVIMDYKAGIDRLFEEGPALSIIEITQREISPALITKIRDSNEFSIQDITSKNQPLSERSQAGLKQVFILDDTSQINNLFDHLKANLPETAMLGEKELVLDEGSLEHTFYPMLLVEIYRKGKTGVLSISSESELNIYFKNGSPVYADGGDREVMIGRILLNTGRIDPEKHREILEKSRESKMKVGEVLIDSGTITPHELSTYLELQIEEKVLRGFCSLSGEYSFREDAKLPDAIVEYDIKLPKVMNEAVKRFVYAEKIEDANSKIKLSSKSESLISNMELKPKELRMLQLLKNNMSVKDILSQTRLEKYEALKLLYLLGLFKAIKLPGVSLESIGRKSVERYISENKIATKTHEDSEIKQELEELIELEIEVYESEKAVGNGYLRSPEKIIPTHIETLVVELTEESEDDDYSEDLIRIEASPEDTRELGEALELEHSARGEEDAKTPETPLEIETDPEEIGLQSERELGVGETDPALFTQDSLAETKSKSLPQTPKEISIDDTDIFSTFETGDHAIEQGATLEEQDSPLKDEGAMSGDDKSATGDEFTQRVLEFHDSLPQKDYYQILGVAQEVHPEEIRDAYFKLVKDYHPDVNQNIPEDISEKAQEIFTAINTAYETLSDSERRESYNSQEQISELKTQAQSIYEAELEFKRGQTLLTQRNYCEAAAKLGEALNMNPGESAYIGAYAWARYLASEGKSAIVEELIGDLIRAIDINSSIAENYYYLGSIYKSRDDIRKAEQYYEKAIETDPNYIEAKRELRLISTRKRDNIKGRKDSRIEKRFWSSLFKK